MKTRKQTIIYKDFQSLRKALHSGESASKQSPADKCLSLNGPEGKEEHAKALLKDKSTTGTNNNELFPLAFT